MYIVSLLYTCIAHMLKFMNVENNYKSTPDCHFTFYQLNTLHLNIKDIYIFIYLNGINLEVSKIWKFLKVASFWNLKVSEICKIVLHWRSGKISLINSVAILNSSSVAFCRRKDAYFIFKSMSLFFIIVYRWRPLDLRLNVNIFEAIKVLLKQWLAEFTS